ncbi:hypothetical protein D3C75_1260630 [compost metagenome]
MTVGKAGDDAESVEYRHWRQIGQAHHHYLPQLQAFTQLRLCCLIDVSHISRHGSSPRCPLLVTV